MLTEETRQGNEEALAAGRESDINEGMILDDG
jgi:hypothetical protein